VAYKPTSFSRPISSENLAFKSVSDWTGLALNVKLPAFAAELQHDARSAPAAIDQYILYPQGARQQTRRPPPLLLSIDWTDRRMDGLPTVS